MRRLTVFNNVSVDGYFVDAKGDMSWAHVHQDDEWREYIAGNVSGEGMLLFGRVTYEMMAGFWPTPAAIESLPAVAARMNTAQKVVFSRTLAGASWDNTRLVRGDPAAEVARWKAERGPDMVILGSGSIVAQLAAKGLVDEFQLVVVPIALGSGRTLFHGLGARVALRRTRARVFGNGNVLLSYAPAG